MLIGKLRDRQPLDEVHDEVGLTVLGHAAVQQPRDVGVVEARQGLPLTAKPPNRILAIEPTFDELDRDGLFIRPIRARSAVDGSHPT